MKVDKNEFFRQATIRICGTLDIETALERGFQYLRDFIPVTNMSLDVFDPLLNTIRNVASVTDQEEADFGRVLPVFEKEKDEIQSRWESIEEIKIINQPESDPHIRSLFQTLGRKLDFSVMLMRLELEGSRVGGMKLMTNGTGRYTDEHAQLLLLLHEPFAIALANAIQHEEVLKLKDMSIDDNRYLHRQLWELSGADIIGADFGLKDVISMVGQVAPLDNPVLLLGETGVGKEVIANAIHYSSPRKDGPLIKVNCGAIPENLLDSELFGHEKGAFTGAITRKRGRFERAQKGTIFLDEIGEMPPQAQIRLLHVLQNREIERVGGTESIPVDIRIISATHRNLEEMISSGRFREDLWYRINVFPIMIPPLRQRKEDIPALLNYFIERKSIELNLKDRPKPAPGTVHRLMDHNWPGNVRELENLVERALIQYRGGLLYFDHLLVSSPNARKAAYEKPSENGLLSSLDEINKQYIMLALKRATGKISGPGGAAELLKVHPNTLRKKMDKLRIQYSRKHDILFGK